MPLKSANHRVSIRIAIPQVLQSVCNVALVLKQLAVVAAGSATDIRRALGRLRPLFARAAVSSSDRQNVRFPGLTPLRKTAFVFPVSVIARQVLRAAKRRRGAGAKADARSWRMKDRAGAARMKARSR